MFRHISVTILLAAAAAPLAPAADKNTDIKELQRDVALLQDMVKQLQAGQDQKFAALQTATQQALDAATHANAAIAAIQTALQRSLQTQEEKVVTPVVGLSTRMDNLSNDLRTTENAVTDLGTQITKILSRLDDISNAIKVINAPPVAPPTPLDSGSASGATGAGNPSGTIPAGGTQTPPASNTPPMPATDMYQNALTDYRSGQLDFALTEFQNFLRYYDDSPYAPNAQFYIGQIHYAQGDFDTAVKDFDMVLEKYPETTPKNPEARYAKGLSLLKLGKPTQADAEFRDLILHHPHTSQADQACQRIKELGKTCPIPPAGRRAAGKKD